MSITRHMGLIFFLIRFYIVNLQDTF